MQKKQTTKKTPAQGARIDTTSEELSPIEELARECKRNLLLAERLIKAEQETNTRLEKGSKAMQLASELGELLERGLHYQIGALAFREFARETLDKVGRVQKCKSAN